VFCELAALTKGRMPVNTLSTSLRVGALHRYFPAVVRMNSISSSIGEGSTVASGIAVSVVLRGRRDLRGDASLYTAPEAPLSYVAALFDCTIIFGLRLGDPSLLIAHMERDREHVGTAPIGRRRHRAARDRMAHVDRDPGRLC
jgi:hypothetical protein